MAVCNTFSSITKKSGTFFTFSQYMEDLIKHQAYSTSYRVVPSKYIAMDIDVKDLDNYSFPKLLQDGFENACAQFKSKGEWSPEMSKDVFWYFMFNTSELLSFDDNGYIKEINNVGEINIQSHNEYNGMGYAEIYCHIPNSAKHNSYVISQNLNNDNIGTIEAYEQDVCVGLNNTSNPAFVLNRDYIYVGPKDKESKIYHFSWEKDWQHEKFNTVEVTDEKGNKSKQFKINSLVILYDIYDSDDNTLYTDIPMGLYITGDIDSVIVDNETRGTINNSIDKYVYNEDIYDNGTSYGLRICSRFAYAGDSYIKSDEEFELGDGYLSDISYVLASISTTQQKLDEFINKTYETNNNYKELYEVVKNSKVNVPYIKEVSGRKYWFVNGKMLEEIPTCNHSDDPIDDEKLKGFNLELSITNIDGDDIFDVTKTLEQDIYIKWRTTLDGREITPDKITAHVYVNDSKKEVKDIFKKGDPDLGKMLNLYKYTYKHQPVTNETVLDTLMFDIEARFNGLFDNKYDTVKFVVPTLLMKVPHNADEPLITNGADGCVVNDAILESIPYAEKHLLDSRQYIYDYSTNEDEHLVIAYPYEYGLVDYILDGSGYLYYSKNDSTDLDQFIVGTTKLPLIADYDATQINRQYVLVYDNNPASVTNQKLKFI